MNDSVIAPETTEQLKEIVSRETCLLPIGNQTKSPLSSCDGATLVSMRGLSGMVQYEPSEFTFTARAATRLSEIAACSRQAFPAL